MSLAEVARAGQPIAQRADWDMAMQVQWMESIGQAVEHFFTAEAWHDLMRVYATINEFYYMRYVWGYMNECTNICQRMLKAARAAADETVEAEWLHHWAVMNYNYRNHPEAERSCLQGLEITQRTGQERLQAFLLHRLGLVMQELGNFEQARDAYERSAVLKEKVGGLTEVAGVWSQVAELLECEGNLEEALDIQRKCLELADQSSDYDGILKFGLRLARILRKRGDYTAAENMCSEGIRLARRLRYQFHLASTLLEAGLAALGATEYDKAQTFLDESQELAMRLGHPRGRAGVSSALGVLKHYLGNLADARRCYEDALSLDIPEINYSCTVKLGILRLEEGKIEEAQDYFARGIALCRALLEKTPRLYDAPYHLALAQLGSGQPNEAFATYRQALEVCSAKGIVQDTLQNLRLMERAAQPVAGLAEAMALLQRTIEGDSQGNSR